MKIIYRRGWTKKFDEATLGFWDALDSRAVVGPGECTFLPGHVREPGHLGGLQGIQSVMGGPIDDPLLSAIL